MCNGHYKRGCTNKEFRETKPEENISSPVFLCQLQTTHGKKSGTADNLFLSFHRRYTQGHFRMRLYGPHLALLCARTLRQVSKLKPCSLLSQALRTCSSALQRSLGSWAIQEYPMVRRFSLKQLCWVLCTHSKSKASANQRERGPEGMELAILCPPARQTCCYVHQQDEPQDPKTGQVCKLALESSPHFKDRNFLRNFEAHKFLVILALF